MSGVSASLVSRYLLDRTLADRTNSNNLIATIQGTINYMLKYEGFNTDARQQVASLRRDYARSLCALVSTAPRWSSQEIWILISGLKPNTADHVENRPGKSHHGALAAAAYLGKSELVKSLLEGSNIHINRETYYGTPLMCAARGGRCDIARLLLKHRSAEHLAEFPHRSALSLAAFDGNEETVRLLLEAVQSQQWTKNQWNWLQEPMVEAARGGHQQLVDLLKETAVDLFDDSALLVEALITSVLFQAAHHGHVDLVRSALDNGACPNNSERSHPPIWYAASRGHNNVVRLLLARGADQSQPANGNPLIIAVRRGFRSTAEVLLDHGDYDFNLELLNEWVNTAPLKVAAEHGQAHMVRFILDRGFDLDRYPEVGQMAIKWAAANGYDTVVRMLCEAGINVDGPTESASPMLAAMCRGRQNIVETLIELGAKRIDPEKSIYADKFQDGTFPCLHPR